MNLSLYDSISKKTYKFAEADTKHDTTKYKFFEMQVPVKTSYFF